MNSSGKRVVLATIGSLGDLHPMIAVALALEQRGHRAEIATSEVYREKIERLGIRFHPIRPDFSVDDPDLLRRIMDLKTGPEYIIRSLLLPSLRETYDDLARAADGADFLLTGEIVFPTPLLGEKTGLPWGTAILAPMSFFSPHDPPVIAPFAALAPLRHAGVAVNRLFMGFGRRFTRAWGAPINELRSELGLRQTEYAVMDDKFSPHLNLALFSRVLGAPQPDWPSNTVQPGFVFYDRALDGSGIPPELEAYLSSGDAPIVFTLGSAAVRDAGTFYEESAKAAGMLRRRALLLIGENVPPPNLPDGVVAFPYAPFSEVLPRAAAVVHQGGVGTTAQALRAGRPQVVMPYAFDQPDNAARVESLGVARVIPRKKYTASRAASVLSRVLSEGSFRARAAEVAVEMGNENGADGAVKAIEEVMSGSRILRGPVK